ncbi:MAG: beta-galactosidase [Isosphaeraceae bacterium]
MPGPADWKPFGFLVVELSNPGPRPVEAHIRIDDSAEADGLKHCRTARGVVPPGSVARLAVDFTASNPEALGMRAGPPLPGALLATAHGDPKFDRGHIVAVKLFLNQPAQAERLVVRSATLLPARSLDGIVDRFGQYAGAEWPGKLREEAELVRRREDEAAELTRIKAMPGRDKFGGWADGPKQDATGFFRTERVGGVWWLVDPEGRLFFSSGVDCLRPGSETRVTGRESMFAWLPKPGDPLAACFGATGRAVRGTAGPGKTFDFYQANLRRKYGDDFRDSWQDVSLRRLPSWGFNTVGNWSDWSFYRNGRVPYVATVGIYGDHARVASGSDYWGQMHDPFDPKFAEDVAKAIAPVAKAIQGDPWCVGVFVDNELSWGADGEAGRYGLALGALAARPDSPAHRAFLDLLRKRYGSIDKLNASWNSKFESWDELDRAGYSPKPPFANTADLGDFVVELANRYFEAVRGALKKADPDHLYLGCRFAWRTREAISAAAKHCDVVSFNIYKERVDPQEWAYLNDLGKPAIIGEFHAGALDRGMFHTGLVSARDQADRARIFREYLSSVIDHPALVGCHWFQYADQALTGRALDGENYNIGLVTITDTPYPEMVAAARDIHSGLYTRRAQVPPPPAEK